MWTNFVDWLASFGQRAGTFLRWYCPVDTREEGILFGGMLLIVAALGWIFIIHKIRVSLKKKAERRALNDRIMQMLDNFFARNAGEPYGLRLGDVHAKLRRIEKKLCELQGIGFQMGSVELAEAESVPLGPNVLTVNISTNGVEVVEPSRLKIDPDDASAHISQTTHKFTGTQEKTATLTGKIMKFTRPDGSYMYTTEDGFILPKPTEEPAEKYTLVMVAEQPQDVGPLIKWIDMQMGVEHIGDYFTLSFARRVLKSSIDEGCCVDLVKGDPCVILSPRSDKCLKDDEKRRIVFVMQTRIFTSQDGNLAPADDQVIPKYMNFVRRSNDLRMNQQANILERHICRTEREACRDTCGGVENGIRQEPF